MAQAPHPLDLRGVRGSEVRTVYRLVWDGEPKMGGGHHIMSLAQEFDTFDEAKRAKQVLLDFKTQKPGLRIQKRKVTMWEAVTE